MVVLLLVRRDFEAHYRASATPNRILNDRLAYWPDATCIPLLACDRVSWFHRLDLGEGVFYGVSTLFEQHLISYG